MEEEWRNIDSYENRYYISNMGRVKSLVYVKEKILSNNIMKNWYHKIWLIHNGKYKKLYIHRLVAQAFLWLDIGNKKIIVCHKDDNPSNNKLENLFLWTYKDNTRDMINKWRSYMQKNRRIKVSKWDNLDSFDKYENYDDWFSYL